MSSQVINLQRRIIYSDWRTSDALAFIFGLLSLFYVNLIGQFYITEILLILVAPFLWWGRYRAIFKNKQALRIVILGVVWLLGQVITDLIRQTPLPDLVRGWASIAVFLVCFGSFYLLLLDNIRRIFIFSVGYGISGLAVFFFQPSQYAIFEPWKFGVGPSIVLLVILAVILFSRGNLHRVRWWGWIITLVGFLSVYFNARSLGGIAVLSSFVLLLRVSPYIGRLIARPRLSNYLFTIALLFGMVWAGISAYAFFASEGILGQDAKIKLRTQSNGSVLGILLGGRTEILASSSAIMDSPIIGHGSWAKDPKYRLQIYQLSRLGYAIDFSAVDNYFNRSDLIPAHSHFTQAWVWAGILGAIFWGWILIFIGLTFFKANSTPDPLYPLIIYLAVNSP